ncbi:hypothetical protein CU098_002506 [Rhizopus stolonifer]|uniref:SGNH hydrolase-type esterase domain-containing protein n=1 Tax=Rhizopus stolonifer TaxID=4846 RepID=A0A367KKH0_RHIST|nr:hypothetical protein CU098_002506 [Rhizopus stolonifer]
MNYGYAYATTNNVDVYSQVGNYIVPGLKQQVETIFVNGTSKDLYVIFFGYNDLNAILNPNIYYTINKRYSKEKVVQNVIESVQQLVKMYGAKHFLIMTAPPFDQFPAFKGIRQQETTQLIKDYNALLQSRLLQKVKGVDIKFLDDNAWLLEQLAHPEKVNVKTTSEPCVWGLGNTTSCDDAENHFFWDSFHPTTKVHQAMGEWVVSQLKGLYEFKHH